MVAPGFRSRIATGLLVAAVVLPVPIGATSAAAADRRVTPVDRPPHFVHPGDQPEDDFVQEVAGAEDYGLDGYSDDDFAADRRPVDGRGGEAGRRRHGHGHPGAPARFPELPPRFPGMSDAFSGFPHRSPHHHFAGPRGSGRWHHRPHHPFSPAFVGPDGPSYPPGARLRRRGLPAARSPRAARRGGLNRRRPRVPAARSARPRAEAPQALGVRIPCDRGEPGTVVVLASPQCRGPAQ